MYEEIRMTELLKQELLAVTQNAEMETFEKNEIHFRCQSLNTKYDQELRRRI